MTGRLYRHIRVVSRSHSEILLLMVNCIQLIDKCSTICCENVHQ